jgi:hypothetical protein
MRIRRIHLLVAAVLVAGLGVITFVVKLGGSAGISTRAAARKTVSDRLAEFEEPVRTRLGARFQIIGVSYPPRKMVLIGLKQERALEVWVSADKGGFRLLKSYRIMAASGVLGPKLAEGDEQVPEGLYKVESLNPNSRFHLSLRVNYPNQFDRLKGQLDRRRNLGSDIMIHGNAVSIGCLAMGDAAAEELFVLAAKTGLENISIILSPVDFRVRELPSAMPKLPNWAPELYSAIRKELNRFGQRTSD